MRTVSVLCLWISAPIRRDPQSDFESDFMFHVCCGLSQSVLAPYILRTLSTVSVLSPPTKLRCRSSPNLRREYGYSTETVRIQCVHSKEIRAYAVGREYEESTEAADRVRMPA